jgi:methylglutaconyl-CoA hydratase
MNYKLEIDDRGVATVTLNRPELHNAFNDELIKDLISCFSALDKNDLVRVVVLTGSGKSFCAGADLNWMKRMKDYSMEENLSDSQTLCELFTIMNDLQKPLIGKINGAALGGGAGLLAVCDYVVAVDTASFGFTEVRLGLLPAVISPFVIAKIGASHARATFLTGAKFNVTKAINMGLVHQVSSFDKIDEDINELIKEFLQAAPNAQKLAKQLIKEVVNAGEIKNARNYTCEKIAVARKSAEGQEGMSSLLDKRKANWIK